MHNTYIDNTTTQYIKETEMHGYVPMCGIMPLSNSNQKNSNL